MRWVDCCLIVLCIMLLSCLFSLCFLVRLLLDIDVVVCLVCALVVLIYLLTGLLFSCGFVLFVWVWGLFCVFVCALLGVVLNLICYV